LASSDRSITLSKRTVGVALAVVLGLIFGVTQIGHAASSAQPADKMTVTGNNDDQFGPGTTVTVLGGTMKTSTTEDLILQVSMECAIITSTITTNTTEYAFGQVRIRVTVDGVPVQVGGTTPDDGWVVFCNRAQTVTTTGTDTHSIMLATRAANSFNWVKLNVGGAGVSHVIRVLAEFTETPTNATSMAKAIIGRRTLVVEPTKAANNETLGCCP
jgi:hypothetical protein